MKLSRAYPSTIFALAFLFLFSCADAPDQPKEVTGKNVPEWAQNVVWYQIFPERFRDGDPSNNPVAEQINAPDGWEITPWGSDWYAQAEWEKNMDDIYRPVFFRRYGGDLQGVMDKLDYLQDLGVTAIWFNPIFDAVSMHKYDASAYHHIDRHFGPDPEGDVEIMKQEDPSDPSTWQWTSADLLFLDFLEEAKKRGIRIIIDGVWNHTGRDFWAFRDIIEHGEDSRFAEWYKITEFSDEFEDGFNYEGWWGYRGLPEFTEVGDDLHPEVKAHIFAVTERWMAPDGDPSRGVAGWRLDVAEELGHTFWRDWHEHVRSINPEAYTVAEIWTDKALDFVSDDMFNAVMNYRFTYATHEFFIRQSIDAQTFSERISVLLDDFPKPVNLAMQNLMDSHDTERLATQIVNADREFKDDTIVRTPGNDYDIRKPTDEENEVLKLVSLFQFTWKGSPMVYYGTESGVWGADDPDDRKPMIWPDIEYDDEVSHRWGRERPRDTVEFNHDLHQWYTKIAEIRHSVDALGSGFAEFLPTGDNERTTAFVRYINEDQFAIVVLNRDENPVQINIEHEFLTGNLTDLISGDTVDVQNGQMQIEIPSVTGMVLIP